MLDQQLITQKELQHIYAGDLQKMEDILIGTSFQRGQADQLKTQLKLSLTCYLNSALWGAEAEVIHL